jgi:hypothetical protein
MKIGLIGESPNDTLSFINLFEREYSKSIEYKLLLEDFPAGNLDNLKPKSIMLRQLRLEYKLEKPDFVVYIRDADALENEPPFANRLNNIYKLGNEIGQNLTYMVCIFEMETLLLADTDCINSYYHTNFTYPHSINDPVDPMLRPDPQKLLIDECGYSPKHCPKLFTTINFQKLLQVRFFAEFVEQFEKRIKTIA